MSLLADFLDGIMSPNTKEDSDSAKDKQDKIEIKLERLVKWLAKQGGRAAIRDIQRRGVAGVKTTQEVRCLLGQLEAQGRGRMVVVQSGRTRQRKTYFELLSGS